MCDSFLIFAICKMHGMTLIIVLKLNFLGWEDNDYAIKMLKLNFFE